MCGGVGDVEVREGLLFDQNEQDCQLLGKAYRAAKPDLDRGWAACLKGLCCKDEPFAKIAQRCLDGQSPLAPAPLGLESTDSSDYLPQDFVFPET
jgi:hypothetical protein